MKNNNYRNLTFLSLSLLAGILTACTATAQETPAQVQESTTFVANLSSTFGNPQFFILGDSRPSELGPGQSFQLNEGIERLFTPPNSGPALSLLEGGNLALHAYREPETGLGFWETGGTNGNLVTMQPNGNLEITDSNNNIVYQTNSAVATAGTNARLRLYFDPFVQIVRVDGALLWSSTTESFSGAGQAFDPGPLDPQYLEAADNALFEIRNGNELHFKTAPDFENPLDGDADNSYLINVIIEETSQNPGQSFEFPAAGSIGQTQLFRVTVTDVAETETLTGTAGDDVIDVTEVNGSVTATINGTTQQFAGVQSLTINSGDGNDQVTFTGAMGVTIDGGNGDDTLTGGSGPDVIMGGAGNDTITGNDGADLLDGGLQADSGTNVNFIDGGNGPDTIIGGAGVDTIDGGRGADTINTFEGNDIISGGNGNDLINAGTGNDSIAGGPANDTINAGPGDDSVSGGTGQDIILGGSGVDDLLGGPSADDIQGGPGNDTIRGGDGADTLSGGTGDDNVSGNTGSDSISGDAGNDVLSGNSGNDTLIGGGGNDTLTGGADSDLLDGGPGTDTAVDTGERGENNIEST